jgi:hypothetical protein
VIPTVYDQKDPRAAYARAHGVTETRELTREQVQTMVDARGRLKRTAANRLAGTTGELALLEAAKLIQDRLVLEGVAVHDNGASTTWERVAKK